MACTPFVRQYDILKASGVIFMPKGVANKRYTPEFNQLAVETMREEGLSLSEIMRRFHINCLNIIKRWKRTYLEEGPKGFAIERRGRKSTGQSAKLSQSVAEDLIAENYKKTLITC